MPARRASPQHNPAPVGAGAAPARLPPPVGGGGLSERVSNRGAVLPPPPQPPTTGWGELEPAFAALASTGTFTGKITPILFETLDVAKLQGVTGAGLTPQAAFRDDDRLRVAVTEQAPWCWICSLVVTTGDQRWGLGTGWLVGPRTVITAGHCLHTRRGGWVRQVEVLVGRNEGARLSAHVSTDFRSVRGWTEEKSWEYDYGAVILPEPVRVSGSFGCRVLPDGTLRQLRYAHVAGYPDDCPPPGALWGSSRSLTEVQARGLLYPISTFTGQSGGPVFFKQGPERYVVGIHTYGGPLANYATRITEDVYNNIMAWRNLEQ